MHNLRLIKRRFPQKAGTIIGLTVILVLSALAIGVGLLLFR